MPGAVLHYETFGTEKPLFVFIPGADGRGTIFHETAKLLAKYFTVVCWDRRGYSQSHLVGSQEFEHRLQTDADDAHRLIESLSPDAGAVVFGTSSGAIVAQQLLASHPQCVVKLISSRAARLLSSPRRISGASTRPHRPHLQCIPRLRT